MFFYYRYIFFFCACICYRIAYLKHVGELNRHRRVHLPSVRGLSGRRIGNMAWPRFCCYSIVAEMYGSGFFFFFFCIILSYSFFFSFLPFISFYCHVITAVASCRVRYSSAVWSVQRGSWNSSLMVWWRLRVVVIGLFDTVLYKLA